MYHFFDECLTHFTSNSDFLFQQMKVNGLPVHHKWGFYHNNQLLILMEVVGDAVILMVES